MNFIYLGKVLLLLVVAVVFLVVFVVFFYGSNFVFVKKFEIGDGKFEFCLFIFI